MLLLLRLVVLLLLLLLAVMLYVFVNCENWQRNFLLNHSVDEHASRRTV